MTLKPKIAQYVADIVAALQNAGYEAYIVGGAVRDFLLDRQPKDYDLSTSATPEEIKKVFRKQRCMIIGRRFRLVHLYHGKEILESRIPLQVNDVLITMSDGAIYAGVGKSMNFGWQRENIKDFAEAFYDPSLSAKLIATYIVDECNRLYEGEPGDDTTVAALRIMPRCPVNLMIGPPADPKDVNKMMALFFGKEGKRIVCGGTTSKLAAEYLGKPLRASLDYNADPEIPPIAYIDGVDLVTEGVITLSRVVEYAHQYLSGTDFSAAWATRKDGAAMIARILFDEATDVNFFAGRAINPAHQNPNLPINFSIKIQLVEELANCLRKMGKEVKLSYF